MAEEVAALADESKDGGRKPIGKRLRFEVFKRDGFKCRYCGATPDQHVLQVDHVVPVVEGGTNDPFNLVTACQPCNAGKTSKPLVAGPVPEKPSLRAIREQAKQVRAYLKARECEAEAKEEVARYFVDYWNRTVGPISKEMAIRLAKLTTYEQHSLIIKAMDVLSATDLACPGAKFDPETVLRQQKYFSAVLRNLKTGDTTWQTKRRWRY